VGERSERSHAAAKPYLTHSFAQPRSYETSDGRKHFVAYAPVKATTLVPVQPSDFASGVDSVVQHIYSVGVSISEVDLELPFTKIKDSIEGQVRAKKN
jgi:hypothetical protein